MKDLNLEGLTKVLNDGLDGEVQFEGVVKVFTGKLISSQVLRYKGAASISSSGNGRYSLNGSEFEFLFSPRDGDARTVDAEYQSIVIPIDLSQDAILRIENPIGIKY